MSNVVPALRQKQKMHAAKSSDIEKRFRKIKTFIFGSGEAGMWTPPTLLVATGTIGRLPGTEKDAVCREPRYFPRGASQRQVGQQGLPRF
jgi:hypothetical protein